MVTIKPVFRMLLMLTALYSAGAAAYQYAYPTPYGYYAPRGYYPGYAPAPYPYPYYRYPAGRPPAQAGQPVQAPAIDTGADRATTPPAVEAFGEGAGVRDETPAYGSGLNDKKRAFIQTLLPYIESENRRLVKLRAQLAAVIGSLENGAPVSAEEQKRLARLASKYRVEGDPLKDAGARAALMQKIDIIPASLALAQAANESAWGESRFAREANNLFGIWTYDESRGLKPLRREEGKTHLVRIFEDFGESVRYYMYTLNSHPAYSELRDIRRQLRQANSDIDGHQLAAGLEKYSAKGSAYIELIQSLIRQHDWALLDSGNQRA
jgi:Bax protein